MIPLLDILKFNKRCNSYNLHFRIITDTLKSFRLELNDLKF